MPGLTVTDVRGIRAPEGAYGVVPGAEYVVDFLPKVKVEAAVPDPRALDATSPPSSEQAAGTKQIGDGKIFVFDLERAIRIRTGESGSGPLRRTP